MIWLILASLFAIAAAIAAGLVLDLALAAIVAVLGYDLDDTAWLVLPVAMLGRLALLAAFVAPIWL